MYEWPVFKTIALIETDLLGEGSSDATSSGKDNFVCLTCFGWI